MLISSDNLKLKYRENHHIIIFSDERALETSIYHNPRQVTLNCSPENSQNLKQDVRRKNMSIKFAHCLFCLARVVYSEIICNFQY